jgi:hypothetical protein
MGQLVTRVDFSQADTYISAFSVCQVAWLAAPGAVEAAQPVAS